MDLILLIIVYAVAAISIPVMAFRKGLSWLRALLLSVFLTPFAGAIYLANSTQLPMWYEKRYRCPRCGFSFTEPSEECPYCAAEGHHVKLKETYAKMT